ncbi:HAD-IC family P-type ATPase [Thermomicrobium sp. 4228-Ro]|uniref:cation-translocating P-type ATPase n=1 Tax=Thermomicrobium sp. 4228-Ro TaxID=2993937 RepID=UPI0022496EDF|nr:HAD-IC family P-type ATPase [Thermomicrobium sp. 4228-Ro]MCX2728315.1 HAD-IC family P-type ATPase [Thermomicrobium sp. 4228-Ro]
MRPVSARSSDHSAAELQLDRPWHALSVDAVLRALATTLDGLSAAEARRRLAHFGPNRLAEIPPPNPLRILVHQFASPLIVALGLAAVVAALLGEWIDAGVILAALAINALFGFVQEWRAESAIRSLLRYLSPKARVLRDGVEQIVESEELVPGDIVLLESGMRVPADLRLLTTIALMVDESVLTGESVPVAKRTDPVPVETPLADRTCMAYLGTVVTSGRGRGVVVATGARTEVGRIATVAQRESAPVTPLQQQLARFARTVALFVLTGIVAISAIGLLRGDDLSLLLTFAVGAAVAIVPEDLPVILTIVLAVSVQRMARRNAIVRHLPAVETLGSTTVIGSDKTGTLTENRMTARLVWAAGHEHELPAVSTTADPVDSAVKIPKRASLATLLEQLAPHELVLLGGTLANEAQLASEGTDQPAGIGDPTDVALLVAAQQALADVAALRRRFPILAMLPFEPERRFAAALCASDERPILFVKGAPERVLEMCSHWLSEHGLAPIDRQVIADAAAALAQRGFRVLGVAAGETEQQDESAFANLGGLVFLGLVALWDPPRAGVKEAIARCHAAGIRVLMITGDHAGTAVAIAADLGIASPDSPVLTGRDLARLDDQTLRERVRTVNVYARVEPEQKLRIVRALQSLGETVAVTGDGVNDAPALRAADVGVAMGRSGTDVAREAADIVLADDNFVTIAAAVEEGRAAADNLRKATFFLLSTGAATALILPTALFLGLPLPFYPAQLLWVNLVTNGTQDIALAVEPKERDLMQRRPRPRREGILSTLLWERIALSGIVLAIGTLWIFEHTLAAFGSLDLARTVALTTMVLYQTFQVGNARSSTQSLFRIPPLSNRFLFLATAAALALHIVALHVPFFQFVLRVQPIPWELWPRMILVATTIVLAVELHKAVRRRWPYPSWELSSQAPQTTT